uniref:Uncharacterized protein n=1 Tax=Globisporangium ultimum (strain ATCC 200006 / CBS 805.95 / DAOM BR144) TaxID=431595 RepID=K3WCI3_GLOUD
MDAASLWYALQTFVERNGWRLLGAAVVLHVARRKYREYAQRAHAQRALAAANDPSRVAVLQRETARIREAQQTRLAQTQVPVKKKK